MADFGEIGGFDANTVAPREAFAAIPAGDYDAIIVESKWEAPKKGDGKYLMLKLQILNGPHQNRVLFDRLNLVNKSEQAVAIAKGTLSAICRAVGILTPQDSSELHNRPLRITVKVGTDDKGNPSNEVKSYKSRHVGQQVTPPPASAPQPAAAAGAKPW